MFLRFLCALVAIHLAACSPKNPPADGTVVATTGMIADVARQIAGQHLTVTHLIGEGIDPHSYQARKSDIERIQAASLVLYNGHFLEGKMTRVFESRTPSQSPAIAVTEGLPGVAIIGGESHADPHLWMDLSLWSKVAERIAAEFIKLKPEHADAFRQNLARYQEKLTALDQFAHASFQSIPESQRFLVTAHDAFSYLGRAYGIEVRGIQGISTESEAGTKDLNDLVELLVAQKIPAIFVESSVSDKSVRALVEGARARGHEVKIGGTLFSDAMGPAGTPEGTYLGMMTHNILTITTALGGTPPTLTLPQ